MSDLTEKLTARFPHFLPRASADHISFDCPADVLVETAKVLRDEFGFTLLMDITAVDWEHRSPRFSAVYHFLSIEARTYLRLVVGCEEVGGTPRVPSLVEVHPGANWHERETYDMFGIEFVDHPDLRRILMWDDYPYFPLRKEFPLAGIEVEFPAEDVKEATGARVQAAPMMGGPFVSAASGPMSKAEPRARDESWTESKEKPFEN